jgi:hypothetical protein
MKLQIRDRDRRALIVLAIGMTVYVLVSFVVFPVLDVLRNSAVEAAQKEGELRKYRQALIRKGHYTQLVESARKNMAQSEQRLVRGDNPTLASVELQSIVEDAAKKADISLQQRNMSPAKKKDAFFNEIAITLSFESSPNQLTTFLTEIRNSAKFITVQNAQVVPVQIVQEAPKGEFKKMLRVDLTVSAILLPGASSGS